MTEKEDIGLAFEFYSVFSGKWTMAIIMVLFDGTKRFNEIKAAVPNLTSVVLSEKLKLMETNGIVKRTQYSEMPVRVEYTLTEKGMSTRSIIEGIVSWMKTYGAGSR